MLRRFLYSGALTNLPVQCRGLLSQAYRCDDLWNNRLTHDSMKNISARDLGVSILQNISSIKEVSQLDFDAFVNKIHELDVTSLDFVEKVIKGYSTTQSALHVVDSSPHAVVRTYIQFGEAARILDLLKCRASTGIFLDSVSANLLSDHFYEEKNWAGVVDVIWELCLQDYFYSNDISSFSVAFGLLAAKNLIQSGVHEVVCEPENTDDDEVEYKYVKCIRNPNYDEFFDVERSRLKCGFMLMHLHYAMCKSNPAFLITESLEKIFPSVQPLLLQPIRIFGLCLSEQMNRLSDELAAITTVEQLAAVGFSENVLNRLLETTQSALSRSDDSALERGKPRQPTKSEVATAVQQVERLLQLTGASENQSADFFTRLHQFAHDTVLVDANCSNAETERARQLYQQFAAQRDSTWQQALRSIREKTVVQQTKQTLRQLLDEEETRTNLLSPGNQAEVDLRAWLAPRTRAEARWSRLKEWRRDIIEHRKASTPDFRQG